MEVIDVTLADADLQLERVWSVAKRHRVDSERFLFSRPNTECLYFRDGGLITVAFQQPDVLQEHVRLFINYGHGALPSRRLNLRIPDSPDTRTKDREP